MGETKLSSKPIYKVTLYVLKFMPLFMVLGYFLNTAFVFYSSVLRLITHLVGITIPTFTFIYLSSYTFKFCNYHRIFIHYLILVDVSNAFIWYLNIPIATDTLYAIHVAAIILFSFSSMGKGLWRCFSTSRSYL